MLHKSSEQLKISLDRMYEEYQQVVNDLVQIEEPKLVRIALRDYRPEINIESVTLSSENPSGPVLKYDVTEPESKSVGLIDFMGNSQEKGRNLVLNLSPIDDSEPIIKAKTQFDTFSLIDSEPTHDSLPSIETIIKMRRASPRIDGSSQKSELNQILGFDPNDHVSIPPRSKDSPKHIPNAQTKKLSRIREIMRLALEDKPDESISILPLIIDEQPVKTPSLPTSMFEQNSNIVLTPSEFESFWNNGKNSKRTFLLTSRLSELSNSPFFHNMPVDVSSTKAIEQLTIIDADNSTPVLQATLNKEGMDEISNNIIGPDFSSYFDRLTITCNHTGFSNGIRDSIAQAIDISPTRILPIEDGNLRSD